MPQPLASGPSFGEGHQFPSDPMTTPGWISHEHSELAELIRGPLNTNDSDDDVVSGGDDQLPTADDGGNLGTIRAFGSIEPEAFLRVGVDPVDQCSQGRDVIAVIGEPDLESRSPHRYCTPILLGSIRKFLHHKFTLAGNHWWAWEQRLDCG